MKLKGGIFTAFSIGITVGVIFLGCGVTTKKLDDAEKRINALAQNGMPDSLLTDVRVLLVQIKTTKQYGGGGGASPQKLYDSAMAILSKAEMTYTSATNKIKPQVETLRKTLDTKKQGLTGPQLAEADRLIREADSFIKINKWTEAKKKCEIANAELDSLNKQEKIAKGIKIKLTGTWGGTQKVKNKQEKTDFVETKSFTFSPDGKVTIIEERKGQTNEFVKEDWKFQSRGAYSVKGDTIFVAVNKEKCFKQVYMNLVMKKGRSQWEKKEMPPYDSTITSGKKDRWFTFDFLKENFKKR